MEPLESRFLALISENRQRILRLCRSFRSVRAKQTRFSKRTSLMRRSCSIGARLKEVYDSLGVVLTFLSRTCHHRLSLGNFIRVASSAARSLIR